MDCEAGVLQDWLEVPAFERRRAPGQRTPVRPWLTSPGPGPHAGGEKTADDQVEEAADAGRLQAAGIWA